MAVIYQKIRTQGEGNFYIRIPKNLIDTGVLTEGEDYEVKLKPIKKEEAEV